jgi:AcrR family transcriptional regulator
VTLISRFIKFKPYAQAEVPPAPRRLLGRVLFCEKGFDATSTREIAARSGCNLGLINYYYGSKKGLLLAILKSEMEQGAPDFFTVLQGPATPADRLARFIDLGIDHFVDDGEFLRIVHRELIGSGRHSIGNLVIPIERVITEHIKRFEEVLPGHRSSAHRGAARRGGAVLSRVVPADVEASRGRV